MSDVMNDDGDLDALAAEYVLGTLDPDERAQARALLAADPGFHSKVGVWERRLGELHLMVEPVEPPSQVWDRIKVKLGDLEPSPEPKIAETAPAPEPKAEPKPEPEPEPEATPVAASAPEPTAASLESTAPEPAPAGPLPGEAAWFEATAAELKAVETKLAEVQSLAGEPAAPAAVPGSEQAAEMPPPFPPTAIDRWVAAQPEPLPRRSRSGWLVALMMTLAAVALGGLIAAWRFVPDRLPPQLRPATVLNIPVAPPAPVRPPLPPGSEFEE